MKPFYITTSIAYPSGDPHIGYAMELVQADFLARYYRQGGREVYLLTGLDEHGLKIQRKAEEAGLSAEAYVEEKAQIFQSLAQKLGLSHDRFIRTTDPDHLAMSQALWRRCAAAGDIYKKRYQAWYNVKEEEFLGLVEENPDPSVFGIDPRFLEKIDEENYFFALSRYKDRILTVLKSGSYKVIPQWRLQEILNFVEEKGLSDVSISREKEKLAWGVPVPGDEGQVMYVWFDALTNYLTAAGTVEVSGELTLNERWPADLHCIGKDISRFHALIWTGMLLSAGIELPQELLIHGFINDAEGNKMSKSLGNVVDPFALLERYGSEPVRWFFLKEVATTGDANYSEDRFQGSYFADLANDYGNLVSRLWTMCQKYCEGRVPQPIHIPADPQGIVGETTKAYHAAVADRNINEALQAAHQLVIFCNKLIDEKRPWELAKDPDKKMELDETLYTLLEIVRHYSVLVAPALPLSVSKVSAQLFPQTPLNFDQSSPWGLLQPGSPLALDPLILFAKDV